jgi:hypothetical protein
MGAFGSCGTPGKGLALGRAAEAMLRALGGSEVILRFSGAAVTDDAASNPRLGLATNVSEDITLSPVAVRDATEKILEFSIPTTVVEAQVELRQTGTAEALFQSALGFVHEGKLLRIESVSADVHGGAAYLYRVTAGE